MNRTLERYSRGLLALVCLLALLPTTPAQSKRQPVAGTEHPSGALTQKERDFLLQYLQETRKQLLDEISGLSEAQMKFKPNPFTWSIAGNVEHITVVEDFVFGRITQEIMKSPVRSEWKGENGPRIKDVTTIVVATNRDAEKFRFKAPRAFSPVKKLYAAAAEAVSDFEKVRARSLTYAQTTTEDLRGHFGDHVLVGMIDAYQWLLFLGAHGERHRAQIREIKSHPNFPKE